MKQLSIADHALIEGSLETLGFLQLTTAIRGQFLWLVPQDENKLIVNAVGDVWSADFRKYVLQDFDVGLHEIQMTVENAASLRREVMRMRDNFKANHYYKEAVIMSHVLAWLAKLQQAVTLE